VSGLPEPLSSVLAPSAWTAIDFISDLHLAPETPLTLAALRRYLRSTPAQAVFLLGDIFEVWIGDDARGDAFEAECTALLKFASQDLTLFFMAGNRDFLVGDDMAAAAGFQRLADPCLLEAFGRRWLLSHGDALCLDDKPYQQFRAMARNPAWQAQMLAQPVERRREQARQMRLQSMANQQAMKPENWADLDAEATHAWLRQAAAPVLIHGHTHRPAEHDLGEGLSRWVLSDWDCEHGAPRGGPLRLTAAGLSRPGLGPGLG